MNIEQFYPIYLQCKNVVIDSRKVESGSLFFAFSGESYNAAEKATEARDKGALAVIVEDENYFASENNIFYVPSTLKFLQDLAVFHRDKINIPDRKSVV